MPELGIAIAWHPPGGSPPCPVCPDGGVGAWLLEVGTALAARPRVAFARCGCCGCLYDPAFTEVSVTMPPQMLDYYVEQGAGIDVMVGPLLRVRSEAVRRYLEVGCGYGFCLDFACRELGWRGLGIDPSPLARAGARELGVPIRDGILDASETLPEGPFDLAFASEVLEHVVAPLPFLRAIRRQLGPEGMLALTTPDAAAVLPGAPADVLLRLLSPGHHAVLYGAATLERLLGEAGFAWTHVEAAGGTLRAYAGSEAARGNLGPSRPSADAVRSYLGRRPAAPRRSALASGLAYRRFKADVQAGDHAAAEASRRQLRDATLARHHVDLDAPAAAAALRPRLGDGAAFPFHLPNALYFCGIHELNARGDARRALDCFTAAVAVGEHVRREELAAGIGDGETAALLRESRRHVVVARARAEGAAALAGLAALEAATAAAGGPDAADPPVLPSQLARTRAQVFLELVHRGEHGAARELEPALAAAARERAGTGADDDLAAPVAFALGMSRLAADDPQAAASWFAEAHRLGRGAAPGSAAATIVWEAAFHEAEALRRAGRGARAAALARELVSLAAVPVPASVAARAAGLLAATPAAPAGHALAVGIEVYWRDAHGVYLRGWAHAHEHPVQRLVLEAGPRSTATTRFAERPDVLAHYPGHDHVRHCGFSLYLETAAGVPLALVAETAAGPVGQPLVLPDHSLPRWEPRPREEGLPALMGRFVAEANASGPGVVLEIGVRGLSRTVLEPQLAARRAAYRGVRPLGVDVHPGPLVDVVGDAHELSAFVRPGSAVGVLSASVLEHVEAPWLIAAEVNRVLRLGGVAYHAAPAAWPEHALPNDFWRFTAEGLGALFGPHTGFAVLGAESTGRAAIVPDAVERLDNSELPVHPASTFSHILVRKVAELAPGAVAWPARAGGRVGRARLYPIDGVVGGR